MGSRVTPALFKTDYALDVAYRPEMLPRVAEKSKPIEPSAISQEGRRYFHGSIVQATATLRKAARRQAYGGPA
jgi:hypothetical protein